jgi:tRNA pseudouridine38-40 synthase
MGTAHYKIILTYRGSEFAGFQRQADVRTVQGEFEAGLKKMGWQGQRIMGAGRTDAGVHANGQVVSFYFDWKHTTDDLCNGLNYYLPDDIAVHAVTEVPADFHPRFDANSRHYRYNCFCQPLRDPIREVFAWRVWPATQINRMNDAANALIGVHDFKAFGTATSKGGVTIREVFSAKWVADGDEYQFDIVANAYLYHMVRRITFILVKIGQNEAPVSLIDDGLITGDIKLTGLAPAEGLVLQEVFYS